jgi:hypothetical protein
MQVAGRLWQLLVVQAGLMQHLAAMKDYLLLARGDFWNGFLADAWKLMALPPLPNRAAGDIAVPFQRAALKSSAQDDPLFKLFKLHLSKNPLEVGVGAGQECLCCAWPSGNSCTLCENMCALFGAR